METVTQGAEKLGRSLGSSYEGGAKSALDILFSPVGVLVLVAVFIVVVWLGRR